jgi:peroxiredoxin
MPKLLLLAMFANALAFAQSPKDLLRKTAEHYQALDSYEIAATVTTNIDLPGALGSNLPGSQWVYECTAITAAGSAKYVPKGSPWPTLPEANIVGNGCHIFNRRPEIKPTPDMHPGIDVPSGEIFYDRLNTDVVSVTRIGSETLKLGDEAVPCEILEVIYKGFHGHAAHIPYTSTVRYWISPSKLLLLQKKFKEPDLHNIDHEWTYALTSIKLNQPPPPWLLEAMNHFSGNSVPAWVGKGAPEFTLSDLDHHKVALSSLRGKAVLLDFWATYCGPCKEEMPLIERLRDEYRSKGLEVYGVTDDAPNVARKWMKQYHRKLPTLFDPQGDAFKGYGVDSIPVVILIDRKGKVANYWLGMQPEANLRAAFDKVLAN